MKSSARGKSHSGKPAHAAVLPNAAAGKPVRPALALKAGPLYMVGLSAEKGTTCSVARRSGAIRYYKGFTECRV